MPNNFRFFLVLMFFLIILKDASSQSNDECNGNIFIENVENFCSDFGAFNNINASLSSESNPMCFPQEDFGDVWFSFIAVATDLNIVVVGDAGNVSGGSLQSPQFQLYEGDCANLVEFSCSSDAFEEHIVSTLINSLTIGQTYYIRVAARNGNKGTFQLCLNSFNATPDPSSDCDTGVLLCDKTPFSVPKLEGIGVNTMEVDPASCLDSELSSAWYKWTAGSDGSLSFTIFPNNPNDDIDFAVYELPNGVEDCSDKILLRCMASGENIGDDFSVWEPCTGATGLASGDPDNEEFGGCEDDDNNFASALQMLEGVSYALIVNNYTQSSEGFSIDFGGSGTFLGPEAGFEFDPLEGTQCDIDEVVIMDNSVIPSGFGISDYFISFGQGANPANADNIGPHTVVYESFGQKYVTLQITTEEGCIVNETQVIEIDECCLPDDDLSLNLIDLLNPVCAGDPSGSFATEAMGGNPTYSYRLNDQFPQSQGTFNNLFEGTYTAYVTDIKGCIDSLGFEIVDPIPLVVDAGFDEVIDLGDSIRINGSILSFNTTVDSIFWTPDESILRDFATLSPEVRPFCSENFVLHAIDELGCLGTDTMLLRVNKLRPIFAPNAFSPNFDGVNDKFTLFTNAAATNILYLRVYDRWGNLLFEGNNLMPNRISQGWDGTFRGRPLSNGVYAFIAEVIFLDEVSVLVKGDISIIK